MSKAQTYEAKTEELLLPVTEKYQLEIYDVEFVKEGGECYLRVYIDKPDGVNINDCEQISRALSDLLDEGDFITDSYILEVSSPGLGRQLKKDKHLTRSIGEEIVIKTYKAIADQKEFTGTLKAFDGETVTVEEQGAERVFVRTDIAAIRLAFDF